MDIKTCTVADIVKANFSAARIFKSLGIDFCCGGSVALVDACRAAGVDVYKVVERLNIECREDLTAIPFDTWPTDLLIDYVLKIHHRGIRANGPKLLSDIKHVAGVHSAAHPELNQLVTIFAQSLEELESHLSKEEQVLFPYSLRLFDADMRDEKLEKMHCGTVANPIRVMHSEHNDEGTRYKFIRVLMKDFVVPEDACPSYRLMLEDLERFMDALFEHIHIENNILFPRFVELEKRCVM